PTVGKSMANGPSLQSKVEGLDGFMQAVRKHYKKDPTFSKVLENPAAHSAFRLSNGLSYMTNRQGELVLCLPIGKVDQRTITQVAIDLAHTTISHFG
ncbi:hypothetical protein BD310DRAFT_772969, partial [Dichomitus squalens]